MRENAQQNLLHDMTINSSSKERLAAFRAVPAFANTSDKSLELLAEASEEVVLKQGQTLLRAHVIETHAFLLLEGTLRLLAQDPQRRDLFTVGRLEAGDVIGVVDLLRQAPCEQRLRDNQSFAEFSLALLLKIYQDDPGFERFGSAKALVKELALTHLEHINPAPPTDQNGFDRLSEQSQ